MHTVHIQIHNIAMILKVHGKALKKKMFKKTL